jgi:hypothetical protein
VAATAARSSALCLLRVCFFGVLAEQSVGVFVRAALPGSVRVAKVDRQAGVDGQLGVLGHLGALVPGQRPAQLPGQGADRGGDGVTHGLGAVPGERGAVLDPGTAVTFPWEAGARAW